MCYLAWVLLALFLVGLYVAVGYRLATVVGAVSRC
jgi:hypothetical protein